MNKYYTPKIEEFHIGFEYELDSSPEIFDYRDLDIIDDEIREDRIRVKYLDSQDIESFGFEIDKVVLQEFYKEKKVHIKSDVYRYKIWKVKCQHRPDTHWFKLEALFEDNEWHTLFEGKIKNKSELKIILQQIGVLEE